MIDPDDRVRRSARELESRLPERPQVFITLGSGLGGVADAIRDPIDIPASAIPGLPGSTVSGHAGVFRAGWLNERYVVAQVGRAHLYEGHEPADVTRAVETAALVGCSTFIVTNAAGGLREDWTPGDIMTIADHLNLTGHSPLTGRVRNGGPIFLDLSAAYDAELRDRAVRLADERAVPMRIGVYAGLTGPAYETPAEVRMLRTLGADAVGMSTVLEVVAARAYEMRVLGFSVITNMHRQGIETTHEEVLDVGRVAGERLADLIVAIVGEL